MATRVCSGCGLDVGFLNLTWIKPANIFFCSECNSIFEEWLLQNRLKIISEVVGLKVIINCQTHASADAITNKDITGE